MSGAEDVVAERREGTAPDGVPTRIGQVAMLRHAGDREEARRRFLLLWTEVGEHGDPLHRCTLAHYLAGTHDDPGDALAWDLRALTAAEEVTGDRPDGGEGSPAVRALYPSLHLRLAAGYARLGRPDAARTHLQRARSAARALSGDRYGEGVREAVRRLETLLGEDGSPGGRGRPGQHP
ncbi:hypothetical protein [Streptomyces fungicidicus]|uniref:hypothetical protein n=1 Tax=Streptomyces fungicidicus TaxID=68203 RepID=UPI0033DCB8F0